MVRLPYHQIIWPHNFIKTQKITYGWHGIEEYESIILVKHKKVRDGWHDIKGYNPIPIKNTKIRVGMVCQQMISTSHFIKTQKIRYGWHDTEEYDPLIPLKHKM